MGRIEEDDPARQAAIEDAISRMIWEGSPVQPVCEPSIKNSRFPERVGRGRIPTVPEIAGRIDQLPGQPK